MVCGLDFNYKNHIRFVFTLNLQPLHVKTRNLRLFLSLLSTVLDHQSNLRAIMILFCKDPKVSLARQLLRFLQHGVTTDPFVKVWILNRFMAYLIFGTDAKVSYDIKILILISVSIDMSCTGISTISSSFSNFCCYESNINWSDFLSIFYLISLLYYPLANSVHNS